MAKHPRLKLQKVKKHPAVINRESDLTPGMEVAMCELWNPIGRGMRCMQAAMGLISPREGLGRIEGLKDGYNHTPTWGIIIHDLVTIKWVKTVDLMTSGYDLPYAGISKHHSTNGLDLGERVENFTVHGMDDLLEVVDRVPEITFVEDDGSVVPSPIETTTGFDGLGLEPNTYGLLYFAVDLSILRENR